MFVDPIIMQFPENLDSENFVIATYYCATKPTTNMVKFAAALAIEQTCGTWLKVPGETPEVRERAIGRVVGVYEAPSYQIGIPADATNGGRALKVLESAGIITLNSAAGFNPTLDDIQTYNIGVTIKELKANVIVSALPDVTAAIVNNNYALDFGLSASDAIFADDRLDIEDYWNLIAARTADLSDPDKVEIFRKVVEAYQSDATLEVFNTECRGFYTPAGWDRDLLPQT